MRYLGLDLGTKTLGLAITDRSNTLVSPLTVLRYNESIELIDQLKPIISDNKITTLVLGLPKNMDNSEGFACERSKDFYELLCQNFNLEIILQDERLTTTEAENILISNNSMRRDKRKKIIDGVAAMIILESYLRKVNNRNE